MLPPAHTSRVRGRAGVVVARRMTSSARLKFLCRSSISAHSHHTVARSSTYFRRACRGQAGGRRGQTGGTGSRQWGLRASLECLPALPGSLASAPGPCPSAAVCLLPPRLLTCVAFSKMMRALGRSPCRSYSLAKATHRVWGLPVALSQSTVLTASAAGRGQAGGRRGRQAEGARKGWIQEG